MQIENEEIETREFSTKKVKKAFEELVQVFQDNKLTVGEILIAYGNLGYTLGASIEGYDQKGPSASELEKLYYENPKVGIALMLQGLLVTTWYDDHMKKK